MNKYRHIVPVSGKDSLATALVLHQLNPDIDYELMFNPTGSELPEVFEWLKSVEKHFNKTIHIVGRNLQEIIEDNNFFLPSGQARYCTRQSKIEPMEKWVGKDLCMIYYGIRADEKRIGYVNNKYPNIVPNYPLIENNIGINEVYSIINSYGLKPPTFFWESVYKEVQRILGDFDVKKFLNEWQFDMLFCWRTRANCFHCFYQKKYEWVGLYENNPELFWKAEWYEHQVSEYYWMGENKPLKDLIPQVDKVKRKRVQQIVSIIMKMRQGSLFNLESDLSDKLNQTTCGLFCGK